MIKQIDSIERYADDENGARVDVITRLVDEKGEPLPEADIEVKYIGTAHVSSPEGAFPLQFEINKVANVEEAFTKFTELAEAELAGLEKKMLEQEQKEAKAIVGMDGKPLTDADKETPLIFPPQS